ncbi:MAG: ribosome assembly cofactor RimP [Spirochaetales bacterium]|nr:ribosome assembly cofactor RimP [Spirochaetales bacterium]
MKEYNIEENLAPVLDGMGLALVEASIARHRGDVKVNLILYKEGGIGIQDLTKAQKVLRPRLELAFDREHLSVEISSPGTSRTIKDPREYEIFTGRRMKFLVGDDWQEGILKGSQGDHVLFERDSEEVSLSLESIRKAKLV